MFIIYDNARYLHITCPIMEGTFVPTASQFVLKCLNNGSKTEIHPHGPHEIQASVLRVARWFRILLGQGLLPLIFPLRRLTNFLHVLDRFLSGLSSRLVGEI